METAPIRIALYARVSTKDKGQNPETQLLPLRETARLRQFQIINEYVDFLTGSKERRPQLDRLMEDAKRKRFDAILVWRFDRFARSTRHLLTAMEEFHQLGIQFISLTESIDTTTAMGQMIFTILAAVAQMERSLIQERVRAGIDRARKEGKKLGRPQKLIDRDYVLARFAAGYSISEIARNCGVSRGKIRGVRDAGIKAKEGADQNSIAQAEVTA